MKTLGCVVSALVIGMISAPLVYAQSRGLALVALTMNTGAVIIAEITYDMDSELRVVNLDTGETETYRKARGYKRISAAEAKLLPPKLSASGKRPDSLEVAMAETLPSNSPELFKRLGKFPENLGKYLAWSVGKTNGKQTVAVLPLQDTRGQKTGETVRRAEELTGELARRGVEVVERSRLDQVIGELVMQQGALFDDAQAQKLGRQLGATAVVVGSLAPRGDLADLNLRLVEVATGRVLDAPQVKDIIGLVRERAPIGARPAAGAGTRSFIGRWNLSYPNGRKGSLTAFPDQTLVMQSGAKGRWDQNGPGITLMLPAGPAAKKKGGGASGRFVGRIGPQGERFHVTGPGGVNVSGVRP